MDDYRYSYPGSFFGSLRCISRNSLSFSGIPSPISALHSVILPRLVKKPVYLDYNATTPVDPQVVEQMLPFFTEHFGNPGSKGHAFGWAAAEAVKIARGRIASLIGSTTEEIIFTGGATEALNLGLKGAADAYSRKGKHIVTVQTEHSGIRSSCKNLERAGYEISYLPVNRDGLVNPETLEKAIREDTILVSIMWANNETGVIQPVESLAEMVRSRDVLFLSDATQAVGKIPVSVDHVDLLTSTAHKLYGPKGVGALYVRKRNPRVRIVPQLDGGGQEDGYRSGTLNVPGIVGYGAAAARCQELMKEESHRLSGLRDRFESILMENIRDLQINGGHANRLPHVSNIRFPGVRSANLIAALRDLAFSTGSACSTGSTRPSPVLKAMGLTDEEVFSSLRISFGRFTTEEEVLFAGQRFVEAYHQLQKSTA